MKFTGEHLLTYIKSLYDDIDQCAPTDHNTQAIYRTIISRAYYGAFIESRSFLGLENNTSGGVHGDVSKKMKLRDSSAGNSISSLFSARKKADYTMDHVFTIHNVKDALRQSKKVIDKVKELK